MDMNFAAEAFSTGGGVWLCAKPVGDGKYFIVDSTAMDCISLFDDGGENGEEFPCISMVYSNEVCEMTTAELTIYKEMKSELERTMNNSTDPWLEKLEERVAELKEKFERHSDALESKIQGFRKWVNEQPDCNVLYDAEMKAKALTKAKATYSSIWHSYQEAQSELEEYKDIMGYK